MEVKLSPGAIEDDGGAVISTGGVLGGGERAEPLAGTLAWLADLGDPFSPASLPHSAVPEFVVVGATATAIFAVTISCGGGCWLEWWRMLLFHWFGVRARKKKEERRKRC